MSKDTETLGDAPPHGAPVGDFAAFIARGYGIPDSHVVDRVVRHGGRDGTGLTVFITPVGDGKPLRIHYERETDCSNPNKLRARAAAATRGLTRGGLINSPKAAQAMYEAMCSMADHFESADLDAQTWEWVQQLDRAAAQTPGTPSNYQSLKRLQDHDYSKRLVQDPPTDETGKTLKPVPVQLVDVTTGYRYVTARHTAVFLRYDLGVEDAGSDDQILTRLKQIGGERIEAEQWDAAGRDRRHKVVLVLYRLPDQDPEEN